MAEFSIIYDLEWTYEDKQMVGGQQEIEAEDAYNAVATLQFIVGDKAKVEVIKVIELPNNHKRGDSE